MEMQIPQPRQCLQVGADHAGGQRCPPPDRLGSRPRWLQNSEKNAAGLKELEELVTRRRRRRRCSRGGGVGAREVHGVACPRNRYRSPRIRRRRSEALQVDTTETSDLLDKYMEPFVRLKDLQQQTFEASGAESERTIRQRSQHRVRRPQRCGAGVRRPAGLHCWRAASSVRCATRLRSQNAVKDGKLDNVIETNPPQDETGMLLTSLELPCRVRCARNIRRTRTSAARSPPSGRAQAVIEFDMDGKVLDIE